MDPELCFNFDIHICGACRTQLPTIELFIQHKQLCNFLRSKAGLLNQVENETEIEKSPSCNDNDEKSSSQESGSKSSSSNNSPKKSRLLLPKSPLLPVNLADVNQNNQEAEIAPASPNVESSLDLLVPQAVLTAAIESDVATTSASSIPTSQEGSNTNIVANRQPNVLFKKTPVKYTVVTEPSVPKRYKCEYGSCSYTTLYMKDLERHFRTHTGEKPYFCWQCGKRFTRSDKLKNHERTHTGERPHKCTTCSYATIDRSTLLKHMRIHSDEKPFKCQICPHACRNSSQLIVHLRTHTGDTPFHCPVCSVKFKVNCDLKRHMLLHTGEKPYSCSKCDYKCSVKGNLKTHIKLKHSEGNDLSCPHCPFVSCSRSDLREHVRLHAEKPLRCSQCSYTATNTSTLKIHQRVHSQEKPFQCEFCPYTSRQACNIRTHLKNKHPEKLLKMASRKLMKYGEESDPENAKTAQTSLVVKSGSCLQTFKCPLCAAGFARKDSLQSHLRQHQLIQGETQPAVALAMLQLQTVARDIIITSRSQLEESQQADRPIPSPLPQIDVQRATICDGFENPISSCLEDNELLEGGRNTESDDDDESLLNSTNDLQNQSGIQFLMQDSDSALPQNGAQFVFQVPNSLGMITLPLVSMNQESDSPNNDPDNTATLNSEDNEKAVLQMSGVQPTVQYILHS